MLVTFWHYIGFSKSCVSSSCQSRWVTPLAQCVGTRSTPGAAVSCREGVGRPKPHRNVRETVGVQADHVLRRLLVRRPDRPGSLGRVTTLLGRLGVDIREVRILARTGGPISGYAT